MILSVLIWTYFGVDIVVIIQNRASKKMRLLSFMDNQKGEKNTTLTENSNQKDWNKDKKKVKYNYVHSANV